VSPKNQPPHKVDVAIALSYDGDGAPRLVAKGQGETAQRIMELAKENNVPMREDPELAKLLSKVKLGTEIPPSLFVAVAEVIAFAFRLKGKTIDPEAVEDTRPLLTARRSPYDDHGPGR
jgi:flagellar biosynthesis protein